MSLLLLLTLSFSDLVASFVAFSDVQNRRCTVLDALWSRSAKIAKGKEAFQRSDVLICDTSKRLRTTSNSYDLSSPREWLEYREEITGNGGAYTVLRCEYPGTTGELAGWRVWGESFHIERLCSTYQTLVQEERTRSALAVATRNSFALVRALLEEVEGALCDRLTSLRKTDHPDDMRVIVMMTLLWEAGGNPCDIVVRGHASTSGEALSVWNYNPIPLNATVAVAANNSFSLPNRYNNFPEAKFSTWCRYRRPLESLYKINGVGEVLLVYKPESHRAAENAQILEGLTSNFFALYPNRKLRTAKDNVLHGYARELVLSCAERCGLELEDRPIALKDAHDWEEVFLTSSMRLIVPIGNILIPDNQSEGALRFLELWSSPAKHSQPPKWRLLYEEMLKYQS